MKALDPDLFRKAKAGTLTWAEASDFLNIGARDDNEDLRRIKWGQSWWEFALRPDASDETLNQFRSVQFNYGIERERIVPLAANYIVDRLQRS